MPVASPPSSRDPSRSPLRAASIARLWFGFRDPVGRGAYMATGVALMALKYALEAALVFAATGKIWEPLAFMSPLYKMRMDQLELAPGWLVVTLVLTTLPFMWIGVSMSVRRAVDAGASAWVGLLFMAPILNYVVMLVLALLPSKAGADWHMPAPGPYRQPPPSRRRLDIDPAVTSALLGIACSASLGLGMVGVSVYQLSIYGTSLFFLTPFVMGAMSAFLFNRPYPQSVGKTLLVSLTSIVIAGAGLMLFALEGLVCLIMAFPIAATIALLGGLLGRAIALQTRTAGFSGAAMLMALPGLAGAEAAVQVPELHEVVSMIEVDAPPEAVWPNVIGFSELDPPSEWLFQTGVAYPTRAHIEGEGVGAVRHCEFSTGPFVEPITRWEPPTRLSFDVSKQPDAMKEWSPFRHVHPPHLDGSIRSRRGEFRLIALPGGRTRLEGSTWYELSMSPGMYWQVWSDAMIHSIHLRVLSHVKHLSEEAAAR